MRLLNGFQGLGVQQSSVRWKHSQQDGLAGERMPKTKARIGYEKLGVNGPPQMGPDHILRKQRHRRQQVPVELSAQYGCCQQQLTALVTQRV